MRKGKEKSYEKDGNAMGGYNFIGCNGGDLY